MSCSGTNEKAIEDMLARQAQVEEVSPSFCLAKWLQSTVHLQTGFTHSCHHPVPHKIPLDELKEDPSALHNTKFKQKLRADMRAGGRPKECHYCWDIEDLGQNFLSDRAYKSTNLNWAFPHLGKVKSLTEEKINPTYLEVSFENTCNFKCVYCAPQVSSKLFEEVKTSGMIRLEKDTMYDLDHLKRNKEYPYLKGEKNPYVDAFWEWWPDLYKNLDVFRITGGEPLLSSNTWKVLDWVVENPNPNLILALNTNLGIPTPLVEKLIGYAEKLKKSVKTFQLFTSMESVGEQAEYIRNGLNYERFLKHLHMLLQKTDWDVHFMVTFNALSLPGFESFLQLILDLRKEYNRSEGHNRIPMMISYLRWPFQLNVQILPLAIKEKYAARFQAFALENSKYNHPGRIERIYLEEIDQVNRLCEYMLKTPVDNERLMRNLKTFVHEMDRRRGLNFEKTFPEFAEFFGNRLECSI